MSTREIFYSLREKTPDIISLNYFADYTNSDSGPADMNGGQEDDYVMVDDYSRLSLDNRHRRPGGDSPEHDRQASGVLQASVRLQQSNQTVPSRERQALEHVSYPAPPLQPRYKIPGRPRRLKFVFQTQSPTVRVVLANSQRTSTNQCVDRVQANLVKSY